MSKSKFSQKVSQCLNSFLRISENDTFESIFLKSVKIESVGVDAHSHSTYVDKKIMANIIKAAVKHVLIVQRIHQFFISFWDLMASYIYNRIK